MFFFQLHSFRPPSMPSLTLSQRLLCAAVFVLSCSNIYPEPLVCTHCNAEGEIKFKSVLFFSTKASSNMMDNYRIKRSARPYVHPCRTQRFDTSLSFVLHIHIKQRKHYGVLEKIFHIMYSFNATEGTTVDLHACLCVPIKGVFCFATS